MSRWDAAARSVPPPLDPRQRQVVEKLAEFRARNGEAFVDVVRSKQSGNPLYAFLDAGREGYVKLTSPVVSNLKYSESGRDAMRNIFVAEYQQLCDDVTRIAGGATSRPVRKSIFTARRLRDAFHTGRRRGPRLRQALLGFR